VGYYWLQKNFRPCRPFQAHSEQSWKPKLRRQVVQCQPACKCKVNENQHGSYKTLWEIPICAPPPKKRIVCQTRGVFASRQANKADGRTRTPLEFGVALGTKLLTPIRQSDRSRSRESISLPLVRLV